MEKVSGQISFVIVNYRSRQLLGGCLASILRFGSGCVKEIIVVNNDAEPLDADVSRFARIHDSGGNLGFAAGANLGARHASGDIVCFLNPDAEIASAGLDVIARRFETDQKIGICGPAVLEEGGELQPWSAGKDINISSLIRNNLFGWSGRPYRRATSPVSTGWVSGAAMLVRRDIFEKLGGFDEGFFMYFEDIDFCRRARLAGYSVEYNPALSVRHLGGKSFSGTDRQKKHYFESQDRYFRKNFGRSAVQTVRFLRRLAGIRQ